MNMNTSEINASYSTVDAYNKTYKNQKPTITDTKEANETTNTSTNATASEGVVYESSNIKNMSKSDRASLVEKLKADADARVAQLRSLVEKMFLQQGQKITDADNMWKFLASGDFTVDKATAEAAQEAISEDGYWGVEQTAERIVSFAKALTGGDASKFEEMRKAIDKGFGDAEELWGDELPEISAKTRDRINEMLDEWAAE